MNAAERRNAISSILAASETPVSAASLAARFGVSRQIVVGDVALLRASGANISATPRGYVTARSGAGFICTVACIHSPDDIENELLIMVDNGCIVLDVVIEHPVYGQLTGQLQLASRYDVRQFTDRLSSEGAPPLSALTGGIHLHTLLCPSSAALERTRAALSEAGFLYADND
jgi:transcriptional regulator of NAD metabolism